MYGFKHSHGQRVARGGFHGDRKGRRHGHGRTRGTRGGRGFDQGDLRLVMLGLLAEAPRHGYDIIKLIEEKLGSTYSPSPGVVYPNLTMLEELGYATAASDGVKKVYAITPEGAAFLAAHRAEADAIFERMDRIGETQSEPAPQILRAGENLRAALRLRLTRGKVGEDEVRKIADVLDAAAKAIEQS